jgi:predicted alpha/beta-hydrolase family hydrolase
MGARLAAHGIASQAIGFSRARPGGDFATELDDLRRARDALTAGGAERVVLVGRSFGGRMCTRLAALEPPPALVILGHPISPPGRPRPDDEAALLAVRCPTLIVQGERDTLGPLDVLQRIAAANQHIELYVLRGVGHQFAARESEGLDYGATWLSRVAARP